MAPSTDQRNRVAAIAATNSSEALRLARSIADPWFRCQALSIAAVHLTDRRARTTAIVEALRSANELDEPNRVVTVSAWPIKALALSGDARRLETETARLLGIISTEHSPVRRLDALRMLLGAVIALQPKLARTVAQEFAAACLAPLENGKRNRKGESRLEECLPAIARLDSEWAERLRAQLPSDRSDRAAKAIGAARDVPMSRIVSWPNFDVA